MIIYIIILCIIICIYVITQNHYKIEKLSELSDEEKKNLLEEESKDRAKRKSIFSDEDTAMRRAIKEEGNYAQVLNKQLLTEQAVENTARGETLLASISSGLGALGLRTNLGALGLRTNLGGLRTTQKLPTVDEAFKSVFTKFNNDISTNLPNATKDALGSVGKAVESAVTSAANTVGSWFK
jgi:hypothetical protein